MKLMRKIYLILLLAVLGINISVAQKRVIQGEVIGEEDRMPLPGVSVVVKGTTFGTATNFDGIYSLKIPDDAKFLIFSSVGKTPQEIEIGNKTTINAVMSDDKKTIDEVMVVGYGTQSRKNISGSVGKLEVGDIGESSAGESVESMLQGRIAGVNIQMNSGEPGAAPVVLVRGLGTLSREDGNAVSPPLFVVDGVPYISSGSSGSNALADIDPNDIETITVLKDASSASIYGSRAINGVILITTKRGKSGRPEIRFNSKFGVNFVGQLRNTAGGALERRLKIETYNKYNPDLVLPVYLTDSVNTYWNNSTNWQDKLYQLGNYQNYNFSIRGAGDFGNYSLSMGHLNNEGTMINTGYKRSNLRLNNTLLALNKKLSINAVINISHTDRSKRVSATEPTGGSSLLPSNNSPLYDGLDQLGKFVNGDIGDQFLGNLNFTLYPTKGLVLKSALSANFGRDVSNRHLPWSLVEDGGQSYTNQISESESTHYIVENTLTYSSNYKDKHNYTVLLGTSLEFVESESQYLQNDRREAFTEIINWPQSVVDGGSGHGAYSMGSYFSRLNYSYLGRYLLSGSVRADGSSKFGEDNKWGVFPAASLGWILSDESIFENEEWLSLAKFRLSWGESGGQFSSNYLAQGILESTSNYGTGAGFTPLWKNGFRNKQLTWEQASMWDLGFDLDLFKGKIDLQLDYYRKETKGLLMTLDLANTSGYESVYANAADVVNKGFEFTLNTTNIDNKNLKWETNFNFATNKNWVSGIAGGDEDIVREDGTIIRVGLPANGLFFYKSKGIIQGIDEVPVNPETGKRLSGIGGEFLDVGDKLYEDINGDYLITKEDRIYAGDPVPNINGGFNNNFYWKNWYAYVNTFFIIGRDVVNESILDRLQYSKSMGGQIPDLTKYEIWQNPGEPAKYPSINPWNERPQVYEYDTDYLEDGSYLKITSITLGYNFTPAQIKKLRLRQLKAYTTVSNIYTFQNYSGPDAENISNGGWDTSNGYPSPITVLLGLTIGF